MENYFRNGAIRWQLGLSKSIEAALSIFALALTIAELLRFEVFDLAQGHGIYYS